MPEVAAEDTAARVVRRWPWLRLVIILGSIAGLVTLALMLPLVAWAEWLQATVSGLGWPGVFLFIGMLALWNLVFPAGPVQVVAGLVYGTAGGVAVVYVGVSLAMVISFVLARSWLRRFVRRWLDGRPKMRALDQALGVRGWRVVLLLRLGNLIPSHLVGWILGSTQVSLRTALTASWVGKAPGVVASVALGAAGGASLDPDAAGPGWWMWVAVGVGLTATAVAPIYLAVVARRAIAEASPSADADVAAAEPTLDPSQDPGQQSGPAAAADQPAQPVSPSELPGNKPPPDGSP